MFQLPLEDTADTRNHPAPCDTTEFQKELAKLDDRLRIVWGQSELQFARGVMRVKYPTLFRRETKTFIYGKPVEDGTFGAKIVKIFQPEWQRRRELKLPAFHKLITHQVEWMGVPRFAIEQLMPVNDTEEGWEKNRYTYHAERGPKWLPRVHVPHLDVWKEDTNGPWQGQRYDFVTWVKRDNGSLYGEYKAPDLSTLEHVKKLLWEREHVSRETPEIRERRAFQEARERQQREEDELAQAIYADAKDWRYQYFGHLLPRVAMREGNSEKMNKQTKVGRAV